MKSIQARFLREQKQHPLLSDLINFTKAIRNQNFTKRVISKNLYELVDKGDYKHLEASAKKDLISHLVNLSKPSEDSTKQAFF